MKHWAYVTAACYAAFLVLLTIPVLAISGWELPAIEAYQQWGYWLWIGLFVICQFCLLLIPVSIAERRPVRRRHVGFLVGTTSFLLANLVLAGVLALGAGIFGDNSSRPIEWFGDKSSQNPILVALADLVPAATTDRAADEVRKAIGYFTDHAARMDYPGFVARQLPIGSGVVESTNKTLIAAREKGAGMRWSGTGAQAVASLRALQRSGRWEAFWRTHPQRRRPPVAPRRPRPTTAQPTPRAEAA